MSFEPNLLYNEYERPLNVSFNQSTHSYDIPPLEECCSWRQGLLTLLYSFTSLLSFSGNIISIVVLSVGNRSSRELKKFLINLSVADILMALFSIPFTYTDFMLGRWIFPSIVCPFAQFITIFALSASVGTLTVIAVERYLAVIRPLQNYLISDKRTILLLIIVWFIATILATPQLFTTKTVPFNHGNNSYVKCNEVASYHYSSTYSIIIFVITFILPFFTLLYVYGSIGVRMIRRQIPGVGSNQQQVLATLKTIKMSAVVVLLFIVCWLPIQLFNLAIWTIDPFVLMRDLQITPDTYYTLFFVFHWVSMAHSFVNPIIYCFMSKNFREDFHTIVSRFITRKYSNRTSDDYDIPHRSIRKVSLSITLYKKNFFVETKV